MSKAVIGIAKTIGQTEFVADQIQGELGIPLSDISVLVPDTSEVHDVGHIKATKAPEGATAGGVTGGVIGGGLGLLAGLGTIAIPGLGALVAAGPLMAALSGAAAGATAGGVVGALVGLGIPEYEAKAYEGRLREGSFLIAVHNLKGKQSDAVRELMEREDLEDISVVGEAHPD